MFVNIVFVNIVFVNIVFIIIPEGEPGAWRGACVYVLKPNTEVGRGEPGGGRRAPGARRGGLFVNTVTSAFVYQHGLFTNNGVGWGAGGGGRGA